MENMGKGKQILRNILCIIIGMIFIIGTTAPVRAELNLTQEEKNYIEQVNILKVVSSEGTAPFQYTDRNGEIKGISRRILEEISDITGLIFEYKLYDSIEEIFNSEYDIILGLSKNYTPTNIDLSFPYIKTETILYINSSIDSNNLENKIYSAIEGGSLPDGIEEENAVYYKTREDSLNSVEFGEADYGYGNAYSVAFYTLQNGYKNIVTIPKGKESREYCMGIPNDNDILLSIINKSLKTIDENQMQNLILDETSHIDRKVTLSMIIHEYGKQIFGSISLVIGILMLSVITNIRVKNKLILQNKRYELLSHISNEYLYEYDMKNDHLELSEKCFQLFGNQEESIEVRRLLKEGILNKSLEENIDELKLPLLNGEIGVFKLVSSSISDDNGKVYSIIGKIIDISEEVAEKKELIIKTQVDGLTGLYNAMTTKKLINESIRNNNGDKIDALIVLDFDNFKNVNDTFGHLIGDQALISLSSTLKLIFRESDIIGRIGGDEFCIYMKNIHSFESVQLKCEQINKLLRQTNQELNISISAGIASIEVGNTYKDLFQKADDALYHAKGKGGAQVCIYQEK